MMTGSNYVLLIILAILAVTGDIGAVERNIPANIRALPLISIWIVLFTSRLGTTMTWTADSFLSLAIGCALIYTSSNVIHNPALLPSVILTFGSATFFASQKMQEGR
jgi:hypothetical protein